MLDQAPEGGSKRRHGRLDLRHAAPLGVVLAVFAASRIGAAIAGVRFDATTLTSFWQIADPTLLRTDLLRTVWYLHSQPPLYNLLLGLGLEVAGAHFAGVAHAVQTGLGLAAVVALYALLVFVRVPRWPAAVVTALFAASPPMLLFENWLFYEYPVATLLLLATLAFACFQRRPSFARGLAVFTLLAAVCGIRSSFQIVFLLLVLALMLAAFPGQRVMIASAAAVPVLLVAGIYVKNWAVVGTPTTSSWTGMNLMQVAVHGMSTEERLGLVRRGTLSRISSVDVFQPLDAYDGLVAPPRPRGIPVLDERTKGSGVPNFNNLEYVAISNAYLHDFFRVLRHRPGAYLAGVEEGLRLAVTPSTNNDFVTANRGRIRAWERVFDAAVLWRTPRAAGTAWAVVLAYLLALSFGAAQTVRVLRRRGGSPTLAFAWVVLAYTALVVTFGEVVENQRIRFDVDPLALLLVAAFAAGRWRRTVARDTPARPRRSTSRDPILRRFGDRGE